jgi:hypothetical protein
MASTLLQRPRLFYIFVVAAVIFKFLLYVFLSGFLSDSLELVTLKSSLKNMKESIYLFRHQIPLFHLPDSMVLNAASILVLLFQFFI